MLSDARPLASAYPSAQGVSPQAQGALFHGRHTLVGVVGRGFSCSHGHTVDLSARCGNRIRACASTSGAIE